MLIDLHIHTSRYSPCGVSKPEEMVARALESGLQGLVFTEHDIVWPAAELGELQGRFPEVRLYRGIEITSAAGDDYLIYGVTEPGVFWPRMEAIELVRRVRLHDGTVILAHPYRYGPAVPAHLEAHPVDGIEVLSSNILSYAHTQAWALCERLGAFAIAASDAHHTRMLGLYALHLARSVADEGDLASALRKREFSLYVDAARVSSENEALQSHYDEARRLVDLGYDDRAIRDQVPGMSLAIVQGIREGLDVRRPG